MPLIGTVFVSALACGGVGGAGALAWWCLDRLDYDTPTKAIATGIILFSGFSVILATIKKRVERRKQAQDEAKALAKDTERLKRRRAKAIGE